jgi:hypothetical protein
VNAVIENFGSLKGWEIFERLRSCGVSSSAQLHRVSLDWIAVQKEWVSCHPHDHGSAL